MPPTPLERCRGQAGVEFVALLPLVVAGLAAVAQIAVAAHAAWSGAQAARSAARAHAVGSDPATAARAALPTHLEHRLRIRPKHDGVVEVRLRVPALVPAMNLGELAFRARFEPQA